MMRNILRPMLVSALLLITGLAADPLAPVTDDPALPRVLLIGDSISMGYTLPVREKLAGKANVHRPGTNCGSTLRGVEQLDEWLGTGKWDVIHFNFGLHDLKYVDEKGSMVDVEKGKPLVSPEEYEKNLRTILKRLKQTGAKLIWRNTTPIPKGCKGRVTGDEEKYNAVAEKVMKDEQVEIEDLHAFAKPRMKEIGRKANVHFTQKGYRVLADHVAAAIEAALPKK